MPGLIWNGEDACQLTLYCWAHIRKPPQLDANHEER
jgi:hypothetical protein